MTHIHYSKPYPCRKVKRFNAFYCYLPLSPLAERAAVLVRYDEGCAAALSER